MKLSEAKALRDLINQAISEAETDGLYEVELGDYAAILDDHARAEFQAEIDKRKSGD